MLLQCCSLLHTSQIPLNPALQLLLLLFQEGLYNNCFRMDDILLIFLQLFQLLAFLLKYQVLFFQNHLQFVLHLSWILPYLPQLLVFYIFLAKNYKVSQSHPYLLHKLCFYVTFFEANLHILLLLLVFSQVVMLF